MYYIQNKKHTSALVCFLFTKRRKQRIIRHRRKYMFIKNQLENLLQQSFISLGYPLEYATISASNRPLDADYQCNAAFALSKRLKQNPSEIAQNIMKNLPTQTDFTFTFSAPAFINIQLTKQKIEEVVSVVQASKQCGVEPIQEKQTVLLDYGGANIAKELHIGHLRSANIGEALKRVYQLFGYKTISDTHLGDWGLQMGLTIAQLEDDGVLDYYFKSGKTAQAKPTITLEMLNTAYPKASKRKEAEPKFRKKAEDYTLQLQQKKEPVYTVYKDMKAISIKKIKEGYNQLNCYFDLWYGESDAEPYIGKVLTAFATKGLSYLSHGALVVDVAKEGENIPTDKTNEHGEILYKNPMPPLILKKHNGADLYATSELATILMRKEKFAPNKMIYIVDKRQSQHFKQCFRAAEKVGFITADQIYHVEYGTMNGKDGKPFKTRSGETVKLEDMISLIQEKAAEKLKQNGIENNPELALKIGVAAMKFGDLQNSISKDYIFDFDKFCAFEGKTGPYLQYNAARIQSLLKKANEVGGIYSLQYAEERDIIVQALKLLESYETALQDNSLAPICNAVYNLASSFATYYNNVKILTETNTFKRKSSLTLCEFTYKLIAQALHVLAIDIPEKM